jgi:hypothetical protein
MPRAHDHRYPTHPRGRAPNTYLYLLPFEDYSGPVEVLTAVTALMLLPGALVVYMGFNAGGYFPTTPALAALVLAQILLVRIMLSRHPFEGLAPATLAAIGAVGSYALLTLASARWSHSTCRALIEFNRAWCTC